ncbi:MAG: hypothetical protein ACOY9Y_10915 [Bacillota bacterium]
MARPSKHNWRNLFLEYNKGRYKSVAEFARAKGLNPVAVRREFKKFENAPEDVPETEQNETKQRNKTEQNKQEAKQKTHPWEILRKQFLDWPEERVQAYLQQIEARLAELKEIPFEEMTPAEVKELGKLRRERRAILSDPDSERKCTARNRNGEPCGNPAERGKSVCWVHGGAPGSGPPKGSCNALKHGAYQRLYVDSLSPEEQELYEQTHAEVDLDQEIRLVRLKIARLLNREWSFFYDMFGNKREKKISEEDRINGIEILMEQLRKLVEAKAKINHDSSKFEFEKYKTEVELQLKREKLELEKAKVTGGDDPTEDDGFVEAVEGKIEEVWDNEET